MIDFKVSNTTHENNLHGVDDETVIHLFELHNSAHDLL